MEGTIRRAATLPALFLLCGLTGCLSQTTPVEIHYYSPNFPIETRELLRDRFPKDQAADLRLRPVTAAATISESLTWRVSAVEVAFDETNRWAVAPAKLLTAALNRHLYLDGPFYVWANDRSQPNLYVDLLAFEGNSSNNTALVRLSVKLRHAKRQVPAAREFECVKTLANREPRTLARALSLGLDELAHEVAMWATQEHPPH
ncbi:MAG: ABC-type transport auxiliary lipoprotein family protein [Planctomycetota bacterium]